MREPVVLNWAGGEHPFLLRIGDRLALEDACKCGVGPILSRLMSVQVGAFEWRQNDVLETLRLGLIGAGMDRVEAQRLVHTADGQVGLVSLAPVALSVLWHSLKKDAEETDGAQDGDAPKKKAIQPDG